MGLKCPHPHSPSLLACPQGSRPGCCPRVGACPRILWGSPAASARPCVPTAPPPLPPPPLLLLLLLVLVRARTRVPAPLLHSVSLCLWGPHCAPRTPTFFSPPPPQAHCHPWAGPPPTPSPLAPAAPAPAPVPLQRPSRGGKRAAKTSFSAQPTLACLLCPLRCWQRLRGRRSGRQQHGVQGMGA